MRALLSSSALLLFSLVAPSAFAQQYPYGAYGPQRDIYGNLVVPSAQPRGYGDPRYVNGYARVPRPAAIARPYPQQPVDPLVGYPYDSPVTPRPAIPVNTTIATLPERDNGFDAVSPDYAITPQYQRQTVSYRGNESPGTIIIHTPSRYLYLVQEGGRAIRYGIGVGRPGFEWAGRKTVSAKREWPDWYPPREMLKRRPDLPTHMEGGIDNPLGARALYLGSTLYRIHGTNEPDTIGHAVSSGCIRMLNRDVIDLYNRVPVGASVVVI
ncbi:L,D-transpeptidase [Microvirga flavescens]|uniref:L,D-transpeptidase n=1 Tax=Microvirga flavescens TaxID=2249811 RepID=UPI000DDA074F|nr:L,D-transpeptidase [Microvirga flavescens]